MNHPAEHAHAGHSHHGRHAQPDPRQSNAAAHPRAWQLAMSATLHCLLGCGIGEVVGMSIAMSLGWATWPSIALSVTLGFVGGFALGVRPWLRDGYTFRQALKAVLIAEGLSIVVMEAAEVLTQVHVLGLRDAHWTTGLFWLGMAGALAVGFVAAYPVNLWLIRRGVPHRH